MSVANIYGAHLGALGEFSLGQQIPFPPQVGFKPTTLPPAGGGKRFLLGPQLEESHDEPRKKRSKSILPIWRKRELDEESARNAADAANAKELPPALPPPAGILGTTAQEITRAHLPRPLVPQQTPAPPSGLLPQPAPALAQAPQPFATPEPMATPGLVQHFRDAPDQEDTRDAIDVLQAFADLPDEIEDLTDAITILGQFAGDDTEH